jgi:transcription elongation factor GreA
LQDTATGGSLDEAAAPGHVERGRALAFYCRPLPRPARRTMIEALKQKLGDEVEKLRIELNVTLPAEIARAVEMGDLRENSEYKAALERQRLVQARLGQLTMRLSKLSQIDITQIPTDRVGLGSKITVQDQDSKVKESYHLIFGDSVEFDEGQVTMSSPIGRVMLNKQKGDVVVLKLPASTRKLLIVEIVTIHEAKPEEIA